MSEPETDVRADQAEAELLNELAPALALALALHLSRPHPVAPPSTRSMMDQTDHSMPQRRLRQQLSCVQCRRRKVKCDHERPCRRCRIRGWTSQCTYPLHTPSANRDPTSPRASVGRDWQSDSPSIQNRPPFSSTNTGPSPSYGTPDIPTPESGTNDAFLPRRTSQPTVPPRTASEPAPLATPASASPNTFPGWLSAAPTNPTTLSHDIRLSERTDAHAHNPESGPDYSLYVGNGESVYFGRSSCPWLISKFGHIMSYIHQQNGWDRDEKLAFVRIKRLTSQQLMLSQEQEEIPSSGLSSEVPTREITDPLVAKYFQSIERLFPIFHGPSFWREYDSFWQAPPQARLVFVVILLLVICMGNGAMPHDQRPLSRSKIIKWWRLGLTWQGAAAETNERMLSTIQASCLLLILRQVYSLSETAEWVSSGSLVKYAMAMGLHRDPSKFQSIPPEDHELRRRLFYTVLELDLQYCLNSGMKPTLRLGDWDTVLPEVTQETSIHSPNEIPQSPGSDTPIQVHMLSSFKARMQIACCTNAIIPEEDYDKILDLSSQLTKSFAGLSTHRTTSCRVQILLSLYNRYLLTLHVPFALTGDPRFAFSQNVSLTSSLSILDQVAPNPEHAPDPITNHTDHACITALHATGLLFKNAGFYAALYLCHELIRTPSPPNDLNLIQTLGPLKIGVVAPLERFVKTAEERLRTTQFAGKAFLIPRMVLAYHRISEDGSMRSEAEREERLREAGSVVAEICFEVFCSNPEVARVL